MTTRGPRSGSDATRHSLLNSIVSRAVAEYAGHFGSFGVLGSPVRANATHAALVFPASAYASGIFEISGPAISMLLNTNGILMVCGDRICPPPSGVSQSYRYVNTGAARWSAFRFAS